MRWLVFSFSLPVQKLLGLLAAGAIQCLHSQDAGTKGVGGKKEMVLFSGQMEQKLCLSEGSNSKNLSLFNIGVV